MKNLIVTLVGIAALLLISSCQADEKWQVKFIEDDFYLEKQEQRYKIDFDVGTPRFERVEQLNKRFKAVIYFSGDVGTSTIISVRRCLIFDGDDYVANVPYSYHHNGTGEKLGPTWQVTENKITVTDEQTGEKWSFE